MRSHFAGFASVTNKQSRDFQGWKQNRSQYDLADQLAAETPPSVEHRSLKSYLPDVLIWICLASDEYSDLYAID